MGCSSRSILFIIIIFTALNIYISFQPHYQTYYSKNFNSSIEVSSAYGGGVIINGQKKKEFVTMVQKHMVDLNDLGYIPMANITKRVWIDVGSNTDSFLGNCGPCGRRYWPHRSQRTLNQEFRQSNDLFVIAIDPSDNYYEPLSKIPRLIPIIAAIFPIEGTRAFYEYGGPGCSSLLKPNTNIDKKLSKHGWFNPCTQVTKITGVSTLRLETILSIIDPRFNIELLKVDAQGVDLDVVKSAGKELKRIEKIIIETQIDNKKQNASNILYQNANTATETFEYMKRNGFSFVENLSNIENKEIEEYNYVFNNILF